MLLSQILISLALFLVLLLTLIKSLISDFSLNTFSREEVTSYECGFEQYSLSRIPVSIRYFLLTLIFLIFDLEIILLVFSPLDLLFGINKLYLSFVSIVFILILFIGLIYEWYDGALDWVM